MKISFTTVTWYSQIVAIVLFVIVFFVGFYISREYGNEYVGQYVSQYVKTYTAPLPSAAAKLINNVTFFCPAGSFIAAQFMNDASGKSSVDIELSDGRTFSLPQVISADGARYANPTESIIFWNKGNGAFIEENGTTTYSGCVTNM